MTPSTMEHSGRLPMAASPVLGCQMTVTASNTTVLCRGSTPTTPRMTEPGEGTTMVTSSIVLEVSTALYLVLAWLLRHRLRSTASALRHRFSAFRQMLVSPPRSSSCWMSGMSSARGVAKRPDPLPGVPNVGGKNPSVEWWSAPALILR
jgi:hypothetical protein